MLKRLITNAVKYFLIWGSAFAAGWFAQRENIGFFFFSMIILVICGIHDWSTENPYEEEKTPK